MAYKLEGTQNSVNNRNDEMNQEIQELSAGVGEVDGVVPHIRVAVPGLRVVRLALNGVGGAKAGDATVVVAGQGIIQAAFPVRRLELEDAIGRRDYKRAETILVEETERDRKSIRTARLLMVAGGIFFLDGQYLDSAIAWKKAEATAIWSLASFGSHDVPNGSVSLPASSSAYGLTA